MSLHFFQWCGRRRKDIFRHYVLTKSSKSEVQQTMLSTARPKMPGTRPRDRLGSQEVNCT